MSSLQDHIADVLFFSYSKRQWQTLPFMNTARNGHKMAWVDGKVAAIGGYLESILKDIEIFDGTSWTVHPAQLTQGRWAYGLADYIPSNVISC